MIQYAFLQVHFIPTRSQTIAAQVHLAAQDGWLSWEITAIRRLCRIL